MKLSDIRGERALDILAEIIDPITVIAGDEKIANNLKNSNPLAAAKEMLKSHKREVLDIMAYLNGADPATYNPSIVELPALLLGILNDPVFTDLFTSGDKEETLSGSPTESTGASEN